jgi:hypothetical protein
VMMTEGGGWGCGIPPVPNVHLNFYMRIWAYPSFSHIMIFWPCRSFFMCICIHGQRNHQYEEQILI